MTGFVQHEVELLATEITKNTLIVELKFISQLRNGKMSTKAVFVIGNLFVMLVGGEK